MRRSPLLLIVALAGCGSAERLPAPEAPPSTANGARLDTRARTLTVGAETVDAGVGPAGLAAVGERLYVTDVRQEALLVFETEPDLHLQRRTWLPAEPRGVSADQDGVRVTLGSGETLRFTPGGVER